MRRVRVLAQAADEFEQAVLWYEKESPQLGLRLLDAFERVLKLLKEEHPPWVPVSGQAGTWGARRFIRPRSLILNALCRYDLPRKRMANASK